MTEYPFRSRNLGPVAENASPRITAVVVDETGAFIDGGLLATVTLTLYDMASQAIVNSRNHVNIKGANGGTVDALGNLVWQGTPADTAFLGAGPKETHVALIEWTWGPGASRAGRHEVFLDICNLDMVPATP